MEPFKNHVNPAVVQELAGRIPGTWDRAAFLSLALTGLEALELKARVQHVADALHATLPGPFPTAVAQIVAGLGPDPTHTDRLTADWGVWAFNTFVERHGLAHPEAALDAMERLTCHFSCEFAIRPYFAADPDGVSARVARWTRHPNVHLRRLASEGTRPRLPWGIQLADRIERPERLLPVLEVLRDDPEAYVRRSVANHLNDIAKDHPDWLIDVLGGWLEGADTERRRLVKHALRTQIKAGDGGAYRLVGLEPFVGTATLACEQGGIRVGEALSLRAEVVSTHDRPQRIRLDLGLHLRKKRGNTTVKVFHWTERTLAPGEVLVIDKRFPIQPVTTRVFHAGDQAIDLRVNGVETPRIAFSLDVDPGTT